MASEKFSNNGASLLNGAINNSTTSVVVDSAASFPSGPQFRIKIDDEIMLVTAIAGTTFTVTRGAEGTTAASHSDDAPVTHILTVGSFNQSISDIKQYGTYANLPAAEKAGREYICSDYPLRLYDNGSSWNPFYLATPVTTPSDSGFSWVNQGSATLDTSGYGLYLSAPTNGNSASHRMRTKSHTSPRKYTIGFITGFTDDDHGGAGICLRESSTGKFITMMYWSHNVTDTRIYTEYWSSATSFSSGVDVWKAMHITGTIIWFQIEDNGTNIILRTSRDGVNWANMKSVSRTAHMAGGPNEIAYFLQPQAQAMTMRIVSWKEE